MSDYFGALVNFSGLAAAPRASVSAPAAAPATPDIVESDVVREAAAHLPPPAPRRASVPIEQPATSGRTAAEARPAAPVEHSPARSSASAAASRPLAPRAASAPASPIAPDRVAPTDIAPAATAAMPDEHGHALVRAALSWVAADPQNAAEVPALAHGTKAPATPLPRSSEPSIREQAARVAVDEVDFAPTHAQSQTKPAPPARVVRIEPPEPAHSAARPVPAEAPDEIVEISIGAIHVRVDAPAPPTVAQALPAAAPESSTRSTSERAHERSALARRALRRI